MSIKNNIHNEIMTDSSAFLKKKQEMITIDDAQSNSREQIQTLNKKDLRQPSVSGCAISDLDYFFSEEGFINNQNKSGDLIRVLSYFASALFQKNTLDEVLRDITENCISQLKLENGVIYMFDQENTFLIQKTLFDTNKNKENNNMTPIQIMKGEGVIGEVAQSGKLQCIDTISYDYRYTIYNTNNKSKLSVPIFMNDKVIGVIDSEHSQSKFFNEDYIFLFRLIAKLTAKKIQHVFAKREIHITSDNIHYKELDFLMKEAKIYRDSTLGLDAMAKRLHISNNYLSQLVNKISKRNFTDYINRFRIEDAKLKLRNPHFANYTIIGIALESGFNSKSTFYSTFKKMTGISPKQYRQDITT
ncbi:helix-turn-helix domain-containing protein [Aquimarina sp. I32.4]|uniref:helix-turn-helix domain-containing protein n=1 Tax=Aquimarina sp. I32.4 TaxID=2053903 RepID=UPI0013049466|nr:helix-turn-helix domain-containing protein [Aquimarina sp. I32.4]